MQNPCAASAFETASLSVSNDRCGCEGHECHSSLLVMPDEGGRPVDWAAFLKAYDSSAFCVEFVEMHSDHFIAVFRDAATGDTLLRICVLHAQKAQIEAWMQHAHTEDAF